MKQLLATYLAAEETCDLLMRGRRQPRAGIRIGRHEVAQAHPHTCVLVSEVVLSLALVVPCAHTHARTAAAAAALVGVVSVL